MGAVVCKLPKRKPTEFIVLIVSIIAGLITIAGKFGLFTTTYVTAPITMTNQDYYMVFLGVIIFILAIMLWRKSR